MRSVRLWPAFGKLLTSSQTLRSVRSALACSLCLTLTAGSWGCAERDEITPPPSEQVRQEIRTVGVVAAEFIPEHEFYLALRGRAKSAAKGAGAGALKGVGKAIDETLRHDPIAGIAALIIMVPFGVLFGGTVGAIEAVPESTAQAIEAQIIDGLSNPEMQTLVRDRIAEVLRDETKYDVVILDAGGPSTPNASETYHHLSAQDIDSVLEVSVLTVGMIGSKGADPYLQLFMIARVRLVETKGNTEIYEHKVEFLGLPQRFTKWGVDSGKVVQEDLDRAYQHLAEQIVEEAFLIWWSTP